MQIPGSTFTAADMVGAFTTDVSIEAVKLSADERRLVNALLMTNTPQSWQYLPEDPSPPEAPTPAGQSSGFFLPGEPVGLVGATASPTATAFSDFTKTLKEERGKCPLERGAKAVALADDLRRSLIDTSKGPSPLATAIQLEAAGKNPMVLRIAIEQIGGTSIARSGVLYTFGWPNAATVSAGLLVSFRLIDPAKPGTMTVGEIRCLTPQVNIKKVRDMLRQDTKSAERYRRDMACDFRTS
jgi:hypothetical protein